MSHIGRDWLFRCLDMTFFFKLYSRWKIFKNMSHWYPLSPVDMILINTNVGHVMNILKHSDIVQSYINLDKSHWVITHDNKYHFLESCWQVQSSSVWRRRMISINRHHVFHMQYSTTSSQSVFSMTCHYSSNTVIVIYIWGTVMVDITKQNWQNIPIVL